MAHLLLLALCVATSNSIALHAPAQVKTLGATRSALALLKAGDFEHLARQFSNSEGILALTLPGSRQRCLVIHESRADLARRVCASSVLKDRVAGDVAFPGLTRQRDGERYAAAKTALNSALCGVSARRRIGQTAFAAAFDADHMHDDDAYALCVARMALRVTLFGDDEDTATASAEINQCVRPAWRYYLLFWPPRRSVRVLGVLARGVLGLLARTFDFRTGDGLPRGLPVHRGRLPPQRLRPDGAGLDPPAGDVPLVRVARRLRGLGRRPKYQLGLRGFFGR